MWIRSEQSVCVWCATRTKNNSLNGNKVESIATTVATSKCHDIWFLVSHRIQRTIIYFDDACLDDAVQNRWKIIVAKTHFSGQFCIVCCQWFFSALLRIEPWWFQDQISEGKLVMVLKFNPKSTITIALKFISPRFHRSTRSSALEISWSRREPFDTAHETHCRHCVCSCCGCQHTFTLLHDTPHTPKAS